ncbi:MAG TPA: hypothetical protein VK934_00805 [Fimbriimonas sp.]|nr:hypothetical protein [Fimbriimonas sp.]
MAALAVSAASIAGAQGWPSYCDDPSTTASLYSLDYGNNAVGTDLFGAEAGISGTVIYELCPPTPFTAQAAGLVGFFSGTRGSVQTNNDEYVAMNFGGAFIDGIDPITGETIYAGGGGRANWGYMATVRRDALTGDEAGNFTKWGTSAIDTTFYGASDRYLIAAGTQDSIRVTLRMDALGDAVRVNWRLTNLGAATNIGLWFGQYVEPIRNYTLQPLPMEFVNIPGYKPLKINRRFKRQARPELHVYPMPPHVDFMSTQGDAYTGYRIINDQTDNTGPFPDQTPVDGLDIGLNGWLLGGRWGNDGLFPFARDSDEEYDRFRDINTVNLFGYVQKWFPRPVGASDRPVGERTVDIVAYYKTTWGDSDFSRPYNVVGDAPRVIPVSNDDPFTFQQSQYTLRVYIDNTRGFTEVDKEIPLENVQVRLTLPQGLADANDITRRVITRTISRVNPKIMKFVDFQVQALPTTYGILQYNVEITPQTTSPKKIITGNIVVGSQPYLLIRDAANLVTAPWLFQNSSWAAILGGGSEPLRPDIDFQAFTWDASTQQYVLQTGPQRSMGTWIISNKDVGFKALGGGPQQPQDLGDGAPLQLLKPGWNLVGNPYNYPIQLGQLVGVSGADPRNSYTYQELVDLNVISSSLSFWDEGTQTYKFIGSPQDILQPNTGYWMNVLISQDVTISYPPVLIPFIPRGTGGIRANSDLLWSTNLVAKNSAGVKDDVNVIGFAKNLKAAQKLRAFEPPISPTKNAVSSALVRGTVPAITRLARDIQAEANARTFNWTIFSKVAGATTVSWPTIANVPTKYKVTLVDPVLGKKIDMRASKNYTFSAQASMTRELKIKVENVDAALLSNVTAFPIGTGVNDPIQVGYTLGGPANATVRILRDGSVVRTLVNNIPQSGGTQSVLWNLQNSSGQRAASGTYQAEVTVADQDGVKETKIVSFIIR